MSSSKLTQNHTGMMRKFGAIAAAGVASIAFMVPTASAAGNYRIYAGRDYASAQTSTNRGTQGASYARHGNRSASSGWTRSHSSAYADCGWSNSYAAQVWFR
ncbi:hypothetical protein KIMH_02010 [Bombiscardovia apis]|uniref:Lactococcin 972 family bacteriocin n=1 Tax=Bombiscardovia apis TaxID=2932182 RepID=A0ABM8BB18_9BIFI|nr:hypothetical protein [Bombiscardovia apis]BDR54090.1 hypothetical protein KIMH_02010 [Bombiscardovia apis]